MPHKVVIKLDTSETAIRAKLAVLPPKPNIISEQLPVGDVLFLVDDVPALLIERKDANDFRGSVAKGRFREQRTRMLDLRKQHPNLTLAFLFEGSFDKLYYNPASSIQQRTLEDLANDLGPKYNICRVQSANVMDTVRLIGRYENVYAKKGPPASIVEGASIVATMSLGKKRGVDRLGWSPYALSLIPHLSREAAMSVTAVYPTVLALISTYQQIADERTREELLVGFQYSDGLSIGPTVSRRVYHFLMDIDPPPKKKRAQKSASARPPRAPSPPQKNPFESSSSEEEPPRKRDASPARRTIRLPASSLSIESFDLEAPPVARRNRPVLDDQ